MTFPTTETKLTLTGPSGNLEAVATPAPDGVIPKATAIICHPHPLHGGTMNNKVVSALTRTFKELNLQSVKFNYRGVGNSDGAFANGIGETDDLLAIIDWVKSVSPATELWMAGFSFGAFVSARAATQISPAQLVSVAPQVSRFIEDKLPEITCPWVLVQGEKDEVVNPAEVFSWIETLAQKPQVIRMKDAGHFFHGQLIELRERLVASLK